MPAAHARRQPARRRAPGSRTQAPTSPTVTIWVPVPGGLLDQTLAHRQPPACAHAAPSPAAGRLCVCARARSGQLPRTGPAHCMPSARCDEGVSRWRSRRPSWHAEEDFEQDSFASPLPLPWPTHPITSPPHPTAAGSRPAGSGAISVAARTHHRPASVSPTCASPMPTTSAGPGARGAVCCE